MIYTTTDTIKHESMKYLTTIVAILLIPVIFLSTKLIPVPDSVGRVESVSELKDDVLPHHTVVLSTNNGSVSALAYAGSSKINVGEMVSYRDEGGAMIVGEKYRLPSLVSLTVLFVVVVLLVSGTHGARSLLGLVFSFVVIFKFVLPQILTGSNPIAVALLASIVILMVSYFLSHGVNSKSIIAIVGTLGALIVTGVLAVGYGNLVGLTGLGSEETGFLLDTLPRESFYKLMLAGMIIGSLGVLDDITISQASIVEELKRANHRLRMSELFISAMRVGHDHIASLVNTLILVYAGSALPLLLLFLVSQIGYVDLLNYEALAEEIVRTLVASIGLVSAVPLTTLIASYWYDGSR